MKKNGAARRVSRTPEDRAVRWIVIVSMTVVVGILIIFLGSMAILAIGAYNMNNAINRGTAKEQTIDSLLSNPTVFPEKYRKITPIPTH